MELVITKGKERKTVLSVIGKAKKLAFVFHEHLHDKYVEQYKDTLI